MAAAAAAEQRCNCWVKETATSDDVCVWQRVNV